MSRNNTRKTPAEIAKTFYPATMNYATNMYHALIEQGAKVTFVDVLTSPAVRRFNKNVDKTHKRKILAKLKQKKGVCYKW